MAFSAFMCDLYANSSCSSLLTLKSFATCSAVIPKSFVILFYEKLDNKFHVAGYILSGEAGVRFYPFKNLFLEATLKGGYANYVDALAIGDGKISHDFMYAEVLGMVGYDMSLGFLQKKKKTIPQ